MYVSQRLFTGVYLQRFIYHLFTETEGNRVFCGPESVSLGLSK